MKMIVIYLTFCLRIFILFLVMCNFLPCPLLFYLEVAIGVQGPACQIWNVSRPSPAHILLGEDKHVNTAALTDTFLGQGEG